MTMISYISFVYILHTFNLGLKAKPTCAPRMVLYNKALDLELGSCGVWNLFVFGCGIYSFWFLLRAGRLVGWIGGGVILPYGAVWVYTVCVCLLFVSQPGLADWCCFLISGGPCNLGYAMVFLGFSFMHESFDSGLGGLFGLASSSTTLHN